MENNNKPDSDKPDSDKLKNDKSKSTCKFLMPVDFDLNSNISYIDNNVYLIGENMINMSNKKILHIFKNYTPVNIYYRMEHLKKNVFSLKDNILFYCGDEELVNDKTYHYLLYAKDIINDKIIYEDIIKKPKWGDKGYITNYNNIIILFTTYVSSDSHTKNSNSCMENQVIFIDILKHNSITVPGIIIKFDITKINPKDDWFVYKKKYSFVYNNNSIIIVDINTLEIIEKINVYSKKDYGYYYHIKVDINHVYIKTTEKTYSIYKLQ